METHLQRGDFDRHDLLLAYETAGTWRLESLRKNQSTQRPRTAASGDVRLDPYLNGAEEDRHFRLLNTELAS